MKIFKRLFKRKTDWGVTMVIGGQDYVLYWEKNKKTGEQRFVGQTRKEVGSPEEVMKKINDALGNKPAGSGGGGSCKPDSTTLWEPLYVIDSIPYIANAGGSSVHDRASLKPTGLVWNRESGQVKKEKDDE